MLELASGGQGAGSGPRVFDEALGREAALAGRSRHGPSPRFNQYAPVRVGAWGTCKSAATQARMGPPG